MKTNRGELSEFEIHAIKIRSKKDDIFRKLFAAKDFSICANYKDSYVILDLSRFEWNSLLKFLKCTKKRKFLPKDKDSYSGLSLSDKKANYIYDNSQQHVDYFQKLTQDSDAYWKKMSVERFERMRLRNLLRAKQEAKTAKKYLVKNGVFIRKGDLFVSFDRNKFFRFRDYCLNPANIVDDLRCG